MAKQQFYTCIDPLTDRPITMPYPQTRADAIADGLPKFWPGTVCPEHGEQTVHFVKSGASACCVHRGAVDAYNSAVVTRGEPASPSEARTRGLDFFWSPMAFPRCGHYGKNTLKGTCWECAHARGNSPRQLALQAGHTWYTPDVDDVCAKCGTRSERRVSNGSCRECERRMKGAPAVPFYKDPANAGITLSREAAQSMGLEVYRTGEPCKYGHHGFRYVSTCGCITCMGRA